MIKYNLFTEADREAAEVIISASNKFELYPFEWIIWAKMVLDTLKLARQYARFKETRFANQI